MGAIVDEWRVAFTMYLSELSYVLNGVELRNGIGRGFFSSDSTLPGEFVHPVSVL